MPDLDIVYMQQCTESYGRHFVKGSSDNYYTVTVYDDTRIECNCKDFIYRRAAKGEYCKHIDELLPKLCFWHQIVGQVTQTDYQRENHICPVCGGRTITVRVGV